MGVKILNKHDDPVPEEIAVFYITTTGAGDIVFTNDWFELF